MGKSSIFVAMFNSYVKLPEGNKWNMDIDNDGGYWRFHG